MRFDGVIFDLDGTLTDSAPGLLAGFKHLHTVLGWPLPDDDELRSWLGPPFATVLRDRGYDEATVTDALAVFRTYLTEYGLLEQRVFDGAHDLLEGLRAAAVPTAIATFKLQQDAEFVADRFGFAERVDAVHGRIGDEAGHSKAPVITRALASVGLEPSAGVVMVGDRSHDIASAAEVGLTSIGVAYGYGGEAELREAGADHVVASIADLRALLAG